MLSRIAVQRYIDFLNWQNFLPKCLYIKKKYYLCTAKRKTNCAKPFAQVAELVDAHVSGACAARRAGSSPVLGTLFYSHLFVGEVAELVDALL